MELHEVTQELFGPLAHLAGEWEGSDGMDFSFHHEEEATGFTPYMEKVQLKPFGPVDNGEQHLYGLDYRMAAWRMTELDQDPFHTEVGYWLYDAEAKILSRCFMVPRGSVLIASGQVEPDAKLITYEINIKRIISRALVMCLADGVMRVDDKEIYTAKDLRVGLFKTGQL